MRVHRDSINSLSSELVSLIFHESDQRTDDDSQAWQGESGELIDERLAASGRHDDESVSSIEESFDRLPLSSPEIIMAEALTQQSASVGLVCFLSHPDFFRMNYSSQELGLVRELFLRYNCTRN